MAAIFRELVLTWHGTEYRVKPTMALLNRIEQDISLSRLAQRLSSGDAPLSHLSTVIAHFLKAGGAKVTPEDVYAAIMSDGGESVVRDMASAVMLAVFPQTGKGEAPPKAADTSESAN